MKRIKSKKVHSALVASALAASLICGSIGGALLTSVEAPSLAHASTGGIVNKTPESEANIYYIGTPVEGADASQKGKSPENPMSVTEFASSNLLQAGEGSLKGGDIVRFLPGEHSFDPVVIYSENPVTGAMDYYTTTGNMTINVNGSFDDYIIFESYQPDANSEKATINFKKQSFASTNRGVEIKGSYIYWRNVDVCGAGDNGMYIGGSYNVIENCEFYNNRDTGLQLGRSYSEYTNIDTWPSYNLIKNCTSYNNYDNETYGENADGFAAKLTVGYGNIFDGCIAYRNSDDGWDLYAKADTGNIGAVIMYNCVAFDNGFLQKTQKECNDWYTYTDSQGNEVSSYHKAYDEPNTNKYETRDGDGNGFKLGGGTMEGDVILKNCLAFNNRMHGVTDNSNPGVLSINNVTSYNNGITVDNRAYVSVQDENGNTTYNKTATETGEYFDILLDGTIVDSGWNKIILDEDGIFNSDLYVSLDSDGYILNKADARIKKSGSDDYIRGAYVKGDRANSTSNPDHGKIVISGKIADSESVCNNIDIERTSASYNNFSKILSVIDGSQLTGSDRFKGSGEYSFLAKSQTKSSKITESIDTDYLMGKTGTEIDAIPASAIFEEVVGRDLAFQKLTGRDDYLHYVHETFREDDGTINMGNLFKIKDYTQLFGNANKIGADLTKTSYEDYEHYDYTYLTDGSVNSTAQATVEAVKQMLYLPTNVNACYQDFQAPIRMRGCDIEWTSSNSDVIKVTDVVTESLSGTKTVTVEVYRQTTETQVTFTATIKGPNDVTATKTFTITVKTITYEVGDVIAEGVVNDKVIIDQYAIFSLPKIKVTNATDISGKFLKEGTYEQKTKVFYSPLKGAHQTEVKAFTPSHAGVYEIVTTVKIGNVSKSYSYNIFVVSGAAQVDFLKDATTGEALVGLGVDYDGFHIEGSLNNVSGTLYALITKDATAHPDASEIITNGTAYKITTDDLYAPFKADNSEPYQVHFVICNPNGEASSEVYSTSIEFIQVATKSDFVSLVSSGGDSSKIYQLAADLDFTGDTWNISKSAFVGYFDGQNHTIKGITANNTSEDGVAIFYQLNGGTIVNVKFEDIKLTGKQNVGVIGSAYGGYVGNVKITNINILGDQRIGGLIGRAYEQVGAPLIIDRVSVVNTDTTLKISGTGASARAAGIVGFMQNNAKYKSDFIDIRISNCLVDAVIGSATSKENGGIFGVFDDAYNPTLKHSLTISNCVFLGSCYAESRCGGILAYQKGIDKVEITNCVSYGTLYHAGLSKPVETAQKNCSGIFGGYSTNAPTVVRNCFAKFFEHNQSYNVEVIDESRVSAKSFWTSYVHLDPEIWEVVTQNDTVVKPYVRLK